MQNELKLKDGTILTYENDILLVNGKSDNNWKPVFVPCGDDEPDFFGYVDIRKNKVYDLLGNIDNITNEDAIVL